MANIPLIKQIFKVKILDTINVSFAATDTEKVSNSSERFLYTYNFCIIPDPDFCLQRGPRLNPNCPFDGVSPPDLTVAAETYTIVERVVFRLPKQLLLWAPRTAFHWLFLVGCRKYRCHFHSFFWSLLPERFITDLHTAGLASRPLKKVEVRYWFTVGGRKKGI